MGVSLDARDRPYRVLRHVLVQLRAEIENLSRLNLDLRRAATAATLRRLMDHDARVRQGEALPLPAGGQQERSHARRQAHADRVARRLEVLDGVIDRETRGD